MRTYERVGGQILAYRSKRIKEVKDAHHDNLVGVINCMIEISAERINEALNIKEGIQNDIWR